MNHSWYCRECNYPLDFISQGLYKCAKCGKLYGKLTSYTFPKSIETISANERYL